MVKKTVTLGLALSFATLLAMVPNAHARRGADNPPEPPDCHVEEGVQVCK